MLLALDIGNSAVKGGLFDGDELTQVFSVSTPTSSSTDSGPMKWQELLSPHLDGVTVEQIGVVSVVPARTEAVTRALRTLTQAPITSIGPDMQLPFSLTYETPDTLGVDRLAAAAAGWVHFGREDSRSVLVVDVGTAVNYEVVHREGSYRGGAIGVGPALTRKALSAGTAQLPDVSLTLPDHPVGPSTRTALQSGIMWGLIDSVRGMTTRLAGSLPDTPRLVLTGGWATLLSDHLDRAEHAPHLVLRGVRLLTTMND